MWDEDGSILQDSAIEHGLDALVDPRFVAQARYHRVEAKQLALEQSVAVALRVLPESQGAGTTDVPDWATYRNEEDVTADQPQLDEDITSVGVADRVGAQPEASVTDSLLPYATVVHLALAVPSEPTQSDVAHAFEEGIDLVHTTFRALYAQFLEALQLPTPESAAALSIIIALDVIQHGQRNLVWPLGYYATHAHGLDAPALSPDDLDRLRVAEARDATHHPVMMLIDLRRQAIAAARRTGDTRTAVVMAATACETFLDVLLGGLLWEEGATPEAAAVELNRYRTTLPRLHSLLAPRLGGSWDVQRVSELRAWRAVVVAGRNRVVHSGGLPTPQLAERACDAMIGLVRLFVDRLCAPTTRNRYSMTCLLVAGRQALEPRGGWTRRMRAAADQADELDLWGVFARWYDAVAELRLPADLRRGPEVERVVVNAVVLESGTTYWVRRDEDASLAQLVRPVIDVTELERIAVRECNAADKPSITVSFDAPVEVEPAGVWVPAHRLLPGAAVMRDPSCWYTPPDAPE